MCVQIDRITLARDTERHKYDTTQNFASRDMQSENLGDEKKQRSRKESFYVWKRFWKEWKSVFTCVCVCAYINNEAGLSKEAGSFVTLAS